VFLTILVWVVILSPLWLLLPILLRMASKEKQSRLNDPGSDIGISANYWANY